MRLPIAAPLLMLIAAGAATAAAAQIATIVAPPVATIHRAGSAVRIDGSLDDAAWQNVAPMAIPWEWYPGDNTPAPVRTDVFVTWDDENLYVGFHAFDPEPHRIRARFAERDAALQDDTVGFMIDPFNDDRRAYQFRINPLGVQADAVNSDVEGTEDFYWDAVWESAGRLTADGYVVEVAVPLQQLRVPAIAGPQTWGFIAQRDYPRDVRHRMRSVMTDANRNCLICQFQDVSGFGAGSGGRQLDVTPTLTGSLSEERGRDGRFQRTDDTIEPGVSMRWAMTSSNSLAAMLNPDFSQVEADAAELDVNTRFALSFPEKRPFFLEGADFFETQLPLVFTRSIADPLAGLKFTGKSGPDTYAILVARDRETNFLLPTDQTSFRRTVAQESNTLAARYRREFGASVTAGGLVTARTGSDYSNVVASGDSYLRLTEQDSVRFQFAGSRTDYPDVFQGTLGQPVGTMDGHALTLSYSHADRDWTWAADAGQYSPGFRADVGIFNQIAIRGSSAQIERRIRGDENRWFRNLYIGGGADMKQDYGGEWTEWGADAGFTYEGDRQSLVSVNIAPNQEFYNGRTYHNFRQTVQGSIHATDDLALELYVNWGEAIDFTNERAADFVLIQPAATFNIGRRIRGEVSYARQVFETQQGRRVFALNLPQARFLYHFNGRTFVRAILQYRDVTFNPDEYVVDVPRSDRGFLSQLLFSYRINAQTVFLVGYSDNYAGDRIDLTQTDRTAFLKLSYAWLF